jgi:hypothetical protein
LTFLHQRIFARTYQPCGPFAHGQNASPLGRKNGHGLVGHAVQRVHVIAKAPYTFFTVISGLCVFACTISFCWHRRKVANLKSDNDTLEQKHKARVDSYELRIQRYEQDYKSLEHDNEKLRVLLQEKPRELWVKIMQAPNHKINEPVSLPELVAKQPEYNVLAEHGLIKLDEIAANSTTASSTFAAMTLWKNFNEEPLPPQGSR